MAKQIKTIAWGLGYTESFDEAVNKALAEGWTLVSRYAIHSKSTHDVILYAELEKNDDPQEEPSSGECEVGCETCKYFNVSVCSDPCSICDCGCNPPTHWEPEG